MAQLDNTLPYYEIPDYTESYTEGTVAARMIDALGFRYYWATEGLREEDLNYKPSESGRETRETIEHIYSLSKFIRNSVLINEKDTNIAQFNFEAIRKQTLTNFKLVSDALRNTEAPFQLNTTEVPFWNLINGPISDAIWHCGQVVLLRRASGNPFNSKVNLFSGKVKD
ncbi:hypothetical protein [Mariniflexile sp.]|uniref:hypothetical protein n=1 Tax=Mariniflexile sp. TaxID=1979402 RepID=UPI003567414D